MVRSITAFRFPILAALMGAFLFSATTVDARDNNDRRVHIINQTNYMLTILYAVPAGSSSWGLPILGFDGMVRYDAFWGKADSSVWDFFDGTNTCAYDLMFRSVDDSVGFTVENFNVCTESELVVRE